MIPLEQVTGLFKRTNPKKAAGPDAICGRTLRHCADQLGEVFTKLFQLCVDRCQFPSIWKKSTVIPIPKVKNPRELNDFRPIALTSIVMKNLEKILKGEILSLAAGKIDPLQFAYQTGKGVEDAKLFMLDKVYKHLEKSGSHARILFADFSSAFNKMQPHILIERVSSYFNFPDQLSLLCLNFLIDRTQRVLVNGTMSGPLISNTGSPQGCVFSSVFFILYTDSCRSNRENSLLVKYSDDTALLSLLQGAESNHGCALPDFVQWCDDNLLDLNVSKTKELVIDFRTKKPDPVASSIHGEDVQIVDTYKYLGTVFDSHLKFDKNTESLVKRGQQKVYLLRKINSFNVSKTILCTVYRSYIESLITFSFICWFNGLSVKDRNCLNNIVKICSKITGVKQTDLNTLWKRRVVQKAKGLIDQPDHILSSGFDLLPSGRRYRTVLCSTNRYSKSFIPSAVELLNAER